MHDQTPASRTRTGSVGQRPLLLPALLVGGLIVVLAASAIYREFRSQRQSAETDLQAVADLRQVQVETWLRERLNIARFLSSSTAFAAQYTTWRERGNDQALQTLMNRLVELRHANGSDEVMVLDETGHLVRREAATQRELSPVLRETALRAMASGQVLHTGIYRRDGVEPALRLDIVLPLTATGKPARGALVLRQDPRRELYPLLRNWPVPTASGESILWARRGDQMLALSEFRFAPDIAGRLMRPVSDKQPVVAAVLSGIATGARPIEGMDYRGEPVLAAGRTIANSDWLLVTKIDRREMEEPAWATARWTVGLALLALLMLGVAARLFMQRAALRSSERERDEHRRRLEALSLLQAVTEGSGDAIFAKDIDGRYLLCNQACAQIFGRSADAVIGLHTEDLLPAETAAMLQLNEQRVLQAGQNLVFEECIPTAQGERIHLCTRGPLRDADGQVVGLYGVARDITASRRSEQALRDSETRLRSVFEVLSDGIMVFDAEGTMLSANPGAARLLGLPLNTLAGDWFDIAGWHPLLPDDSPMPPSQLPPARVLATGEPQRDVTVRVGGPNGQRRWFSVSAEPIPGPRAAGQPAVALSFADITERLELTAELERHQRHLQDLVAERTQALQQANEQLGATERFLRLVADNLPVRVAYWDAGIVCRFANREYLRWFGKRADEVLDRHARDIHGAAYFEQVRPQIEAALRGQPLRFERLTPAPDGGPAFHHLVHYVPDQRDDGRVAGVSVLAFDVSALKHAEAALQRLNAELMLARDRAEDANRAKSAFLANMSHEIRTPMSAIIGLTHLMQREATEPTQVDRLAKLGRSAQHLLQIINDILDLSKIEAGRLTLEDIPFSLDGLLTRSFEMVAETAQRKNLELIVDTDHLPDALRGDPTRLSQVLLNLLSNAVKFTDSGWVRLSGEKLAEDGPRVQVRFAVSDTGSGIPADRVGALFSAFEQVDSSISRRHGGTGLGLALTRRLAALMGGEAGVESQPGVGSRFWFTAWLGHSDAAPPAPADAGLQDRRVLLVDDLAEARAALVDRLRQFGLHVDAVESGAQALALAERGIEAGAVYDLLLIDWRMPAMDGVQTLRALRELLGDGLPPAVLVSAHDDAQMRDEARRAQFSGVLVKPVTASSLHDMLARLLHDSPAPAPTLPLPGPGDAEQALRRVAGGRRVLLAEDNPVNQEVALELLRSAGLRADVADNGRQAVQMALASAYALIVMDVQMPELDGLDAARELRRHGLATPIIAMTANAFGEDRAACLAAGMNDHVGKPVDPEALYRTLLRWLPGDNDMTAAAAPDAPSSSELLERCALLPGFDAQLALRSAGGRPEVVERLLRRFAEHYGGGMPSLVEPGGDERLARWGLAAHSLQGAASAVGAAALHRQARGFETTVRAASQAQPLEQDAHALQAALLAFVGALQRTLQ